MVAVNRVNAWRQQSCLYNCCFGISTIGPIGRIIDLTLSERMWRNFDARTFLLVWFRYS